MKINPFNHIQNNPYRKQMEKQEHTSERLNKKDVLEISQAAKELQEHTKMEKARQEKVAQLKERIDSGQYEVDPKAVARKFYEFWSK